MTDGVDTSADTIPRFDDSDSGSVPLELTRRRQPGETRAGNNDPRAVKLSRPHAPA